MARAIKLSHVQSALGQLDYPVTRTDAATELDDVTLLLADGEENLGELISGTGSDSFDSMDELESELNNVLPRGAVGEPYQSEGEG